TANAVKGNVDIIQDENRYFRLGMGEGPTRRLGLLDVLFNSKVSNAWGFRLGVINNQLGGGLTFFPTEKVMYRTDVYDINNEETVGAVTNRLWPKMRLGYEYYWQEYIDFLVTGDDLLNPGDRNVTIGIQVRPSPDRIF
ncbi:MAG: hypothetical protein ABIE84_03580, partial [bacterium]